MKLITKVAANIGHSHTRYGAEDGIDPGQKDFRWTREANDNALLAGVLIRELHGRSPIVTHVFQQQGKETLSSLVHRIDAFYPTVLISLHRNSVTSPKPSGWSVWYHGNNLKGKKLAEIAAQELSKIAAINVDRSGGVRSDFENYPPDAKKEKKGGFRVLQDFADRGILFEGGFISNPIDEIWYDDPNILVSIAQALRIGIENFCGL
ncbi:MAG: N-acetylmuramoyl-L-alanine amidase [bacterium]